MTVRAPAAARIAVAVIVAAIAVACERTAAPSSRPSSTPAASTAAVPSATPTAAATPTPEAASSLDVKTTALGALRGRWIFAGREVAIPPSLMQREVQVWAVPLDGGSPVRAISYPAEVPMIEGISDLTPYLRRQFSPDGTRLVLSIRGELVVVDLTSGQVRRLGTAGVRPAWSRDGSQIAYVAVPSRTQVVPDWRTWIVPAGGGVSREIPGRDGVLAEPIEWSPDGKQLLITTADGIDLVDAASGRVVRHLDELAGAFGHWRDATPQIVLPTFATRGAPVASRLVSLDTGAGAERVLVESKETFDAGGIPSASISFSDPRWSPVADQILYVAVRQNPTGPSAFATHVYDVASGKDAVISPSAYQATWTWDGGQIVYLTPSAAFRGYGASLRIAGRDGSGDRELLGESDNTFFFSVASLSY